MDYGEDIVYYVVATVFFLWFMLVMLSASLFRRLKKDVLGDLPEKRQEVVLLSDSSVHTNLDNLRKAKAAYKQAAVSY